MTFLKKLFGKKPREMREVLQWNGPEGCLVTDMITRKGCRVVYMYREDPAGSEFPDSGWRFFAGTESQEYLDDPAHTQICRLNTVCNLDPDVTPLLHAPYGMAFARDEQGRFRQEALDIPTDE